MKSCDAHCRACGRHFLSDEAFDAHQVFEEDHYGDWDHRVCVGRQDIPDVLELADRDGICEISDPTRPLLHVEILRLAAAKEESAAA